MIRPTRGLLAALLPLTLLAAPVAAQTKVAYVDTRKILQEMPGRNQVEARYRAEVEVLQSREKTMVDSLNLMVAAFDQIKIALEDVRRAEGVAMIFDMGAQANPVVAMDKNLDLSDKVIAKLRTMPAAVPAAAPAPAARPATPAATPAPARPAGPVTQPAGVRRP